MPSGPEGHKEIVTLETDLLPRDSDRLACVAMEQGISLEELTAAALGLYLAASSLVAARPGGMFVYVVDGGYIEIDTGIPGEAIEGERPQLED